MKIVIIDQNAGGLCFWVFLKRRKYLKLYLIGQKKPIKGLIKDA